MLYIVKAPQGGGKTEYLLKEAAARAASGRRCLMIVSQQVSFEYERLILGAFEPRWQSLIEVRSFEALARDIFKEYGGAAARRLTDSAKRAAVRRAVESVGEELYYFRRQRRNEAFYDLAVSELDELAKAGIGPEALQKIADQAGDQPAAGKFREAALIYAAYRAVVEGSYLDEQTSAQAAAGLVKDEYFRGVTAFLDEFDSFTHQQLMLIGRMLQSCDDIFCALTLGGGQSDVLSLAERTRRRLAAKASDCGARLEEISAGGGRRAAGIESLGEFLMYKTPQASSKGVYFSRPRGPYEEARLVAAEICELVRGGESFSDIGVLAGDMARYIMPIKIEFERYKIPYFSDFDRGIAGSPAVTVCLGLLELADSTAMDTDAVLSILKSGLCGVPDGAADIVQNYCFVWDINGEDWHRPFTGNPSGFKKDFTERELHDLRIAEQTRGFISGVVESFREAAQGAEGDEIIALLYSALVSLGCPDTLRRLCAGADEQRAARAAREYRLCCELLDSLHALLAADRLSLSEVAGLIRTEAGAVKLYDIPETLAQVTVGAADRSRPIRKKTVFILGINEGLFPQSSPQNGIFTEHEREMICRGGELGNTFEYLYYDRLLRFYRALTCPLERLFLSAPRCDARGASLEVSALLEEYIEAADPAEFPMPELFPLAQNAGSARFELAGQPAKLARAVLGEEPPPAAPAFTVDDAQELSRFFGEDITLSPSRAECFSRCAFRYFMQYVLSARPLNQAKLDYREVGNLLHYLLQTVMENSGDGFADLEPDWLRALAENAAAEYMSEMAGGADSRRLEYLASRLTSQAVRLLRHIQEEQKRTEFKARDFELEISDRGDLPPRVLRLPGGGSVRVEGKVDRVDVMHSGGEDYIRVVDYKTGSKKFSLPEVYYGISVQMFIYLFSICENGAARYGSPVPAGVMFLHSEPDMQKPAEKAYAMDGLLVRDDRVLAGVKEEQGIFIPAVLDKNGEVKAADALASAEKLGRIGLRIDRILTEMGETIRNGGFAPDPIVVERIDPCEKCDYAAVCRRSPGEPKRAAEVNDISRFEVGEE